MVPMGVCQAQIAMICRNIFVMRYDLLKKYCTFAEKIGNYALDGDER